MNHELVKIFAEMATLLDMQGVAFKPRAFERASQAIAVLDDKIDEVYKQGGLKALEAIDGVGKGIAERIEEYVKTGQIKEYNKLKQAFPVDISGLSQIEGVGPQTIKKLYRELKIKNLSELEKAIEAKRLSKSGKYSAKVEAKLAQGLAFVKSGHGRYSLLEILPLAKQLIEKIRGLPGVQFVEYAGSLRRRQETVGDLDFIVFSNNPQPVIDRFIKFPEVQSIYSHGQRKALVRLKNGFDADLAVLPSQSLGSALIAWTGSKQHNIALRRLAESKNWLLNDYGLWASEKLQRFPATHGNLRREKAKSAKQKLIASRNEEEVYKALGMDWIPPEIRNDTGEVEAALAGELPDLIGYDDIVGDLQVQSDWTDGEHSIRELATAAKQYGLKYIAITDHTKSLVVAHGNDEKHLLQQMAEIDKINRSLSGFKILKGVEVDIHKDGTLDISDEVLAQLDVVGASVHTNRNMSEADMTKRIIRAMENPHVDILFHPTGRIVGRREPYQLDIDAVIKAAKRTQTVLEVNGSSRLDLKDEHIRKAVDAGVKLAIDSDAHDVEQFVFLEYGIAQARRGWATPEDVINSCDWQKMLGLLK